jgi:hypothetical protein
LKGLGDNINLWDHFMDNDSGLHAPAAPKTPIKATLHVIAGLSQKYKKDVEERTKQQPSVALWSESLCVNLSR